MAKIQIPIYRDEISAGLASAVAANQSLAYYSPVLVPAGTLMQAIAANGSLLQGLANLTSADVNFDLYPLYSLLASTGWNKNDDIFDRLDTWMAKDTPEDKPFNEGHIPSKIIGHITGSIVVDEGMVIIPHDTPFDNLPGKFHVLTSAVVYRHINSRDADLEAQAAELIEGIKRGDWFVSMECLFSNFDYGLTTASGEQQIVTRNEKTSFLTKHLRVYQGTGEYNGCKLGRVLRNITFSGKGLVKNPANPESVILNDAQQFIGVAVNFESQHTTNASAGETDMSDELLKEQVKTLQASLAEANEKLQALSTQQVQATIAAKDTEIAGLKDTIAANQKKIEELTASFNGAVAGKETAEKASAELNTKLAEAQKQLEAIKIQSLTTARISTLVDKGVEKTAAEALVAKFAAATDEVFAEVVEMQAQLVVAKKGKTEEEKPGEKPCETKAGDVTTDPKGETTAASADLTNAKPDAEPALAAGDEGSKNDEVISALASFFDTTLTNGREDKSKK